MDSRQGEKGGERKRWLRAQAPVRDSPNRRQAKEDEQREGACLSLPSLSKAATLRPVETPVSHSLSCPGPGVKWI